MYVYIYIHIFVCVCNLCIYIYVCTTWPILGLRIHFITTPWHHRHYYFKSTAVRIVSLCNLWAPQVFTGDDMAMCSVLIGLKSNVSGEVPQTVVRFLRVLILNDPSSGYLANYLKFSGCFTVSPCLICFIWFEQMRHGRTRSFDLL